MIVLPSGATSQVLSDCGSIAIENSFSDIFKKI
jgi:hypothetical protein